MEFIPGQTRKNQRNLIKAWRARRTLHFLGLTTDAQDHAIIRKLQKIKAKYNIQLTKNQEENL